MRTGLQWKKWSGALVLGVAVLCLGNPTFGQTPVRPHPSQKKAAKKPQLPPLPSGPTNQPVQQVPLDSIAAVPPQVSYQNNQLTIVAPNSTLADILRAVRKQTGAEIEVPSAPERVVSHLGPGPARDVVAELLNGSRFNYVLLGSPNDEAQLARVVLVPKSGAENMLASAAGQNPQANNGQPQPDQPIETVADTEQNDDNAVDDAADQAAAEAEQQLQQNQPNAPDQPAIKTPQQMLQEMQQRQMQLQQQQQQQLAPGQPPVPPPGIPQRSPQEQ